MILTLTIFSYHGSFIACHLYPIIGLNNHIYFLNSNHVTLLRVEVALKKIEGMEFIARFHKRNNKIHICPTTHLKKEKTQHFSFLGINYKTV